MDMTDEEILRFICDNTGKRINLPNFTLDELKDFARALLSQQVESAKTSTEVSPYDKIAALMPDGSAASNVYEAFECGRRAALEEAAKLCESLVAESGVHSNFACAMKIRALSSPA